MGGLYTSCAYVKLKYVHSIKVYLVKSRSIALRIKNNNNVQKVKTANNAYFHHLSKFNENLGDRIKVIELLLILFIL